MHNKLTDNIEFFSHYCSCRGTINGVMLDYGDFGEKWDRDPNNAPDYGCGDTRFTRIPSTPQVLAKYSIDEAGYDFICTKLEENLSFGLCGKCA